MASGPRRGSALVRTAPGFFPVSLVSWRGYGRDGMSRWVDTVEKGLALIGEQ